MRASVLLILAALCACASETPEEPAAPAEAPAATQTQPGKRFELLTPVGEIDQPPSEMRWRVGPGLIACRAVIVTPEGQPIWTSPPSDEGLATMPADVQARLTPGEPYLWKVVCAFSGLQLGSEYTEFSLAQP